MAKQRASKDCYPELDQTQRRHIGFLRERLQYVEKKLGERRLVGDAVSYLVEERDALRWVLKELDKVHHVLMSQAIIADAQIGPADLTKLEPKDIAVPQLWPDEQTGGT